MTKKVEYVYDKTGAPMGTVTYKLETFDPYTGKAPAKN